MKRMSSWMAMLLVCVCDIVCGIPCHDALRNEILPIIRDEYLGNVLWWIPLDGLRWIP